MSRTAVKSEKVWIAAAQAAPCNRCYYETYCKGDGKTGWSCPVYRRWEKGYRHQHNLIEERIPDERHHT